VVHQARHRTGSSRWSIRPRSLAALAVAAAGLAASIWLPGSDDAASAAVAQPAFTDDFSALKGTPVDLSNWSVDGDLGDAVQDGDGDLVVIKLLRTKQSFGQRYGHAEARVEGDRAPGVYRAFSVLDQYGRTIPGKLQTLRGGIDPTDGDAFHTYAIDWSPRAIVESVDGHPSLRLLPTRPADGIVLVLNLATDNTGPARLVVDFVHVKVYGRPGMNPTPSPSSASPAPGPTSPAPGPTTASPAPTSASPAPTTTAPTAAPTTPTVAPTTPAAPPTTTAPKPKPTKTAKPWAAFTNYVPGDLVTYLGVTYRVLEAHTSLPGWVPPLLPTLFKKV
jgi:hypothetical protein